MRILLSIFERVEVPHLWLRGREEREERSGGRG
jgi:hypothetical protein